MPYLIEDAKQQQARMKQLYDVLEDLLKQVIIKCRNDLRKSLYQRFISQLSATLSTIIGINHFLHLLLTN